MTTIINSLFENVFDLDKSKNSVQNGNGNGNRSANKKDNDSSIAYTKHKYNPGTPNPSLEQGYKFIQYQNKIESKIHNDLAYKIKPTKKQNKQNTKNTKNTKNTNESFVTHGLKSNTDSSLTETSIAILNETNIDSTQNSIMEQLKQEYNKTLNEYNDLVSKVSQSATNYVNRTSSNNPYLNKIIRFTTGQLYYVTNQGVAKYIPNANVLNSISGKNGCPTNNGNYTDVNVAWTNDYKTVGTQVPTNPPLVIGTNMKLNESCGYEGTNVFVNSMLSNIQNPTYVGCYQDNSTTPAMTFIGGSPSSSNTASGNYTFEQCKNASVLGGYQYFALQNVNSSNGLGYCAVSNSQQNSTQYGNSYVPTGQDPLWSSNTSGQSGNTAILSVTGSLSVINSGGTSVYSTPNSNAQPSNYLGCYGDAPNRAMSMFARGSQNFNLQTCQQIAQQNGSTYFGLQDSTSGTNAQCAISSNWSQTSKYGPAGNCTQLSNGSWSGGGWSNAVYNTTLPQSNYVLTLLDSGNMTITRGTSPNDNQGLIWQSGTKGQQKDANSAYAAANGKYGTNWITSGSTMAAGDFIGSPNGYIALIMQSDGNLVLYTFTEALNCQQMSGGNMGGGVLANAIYNIGNVGITANMGEVAYVDADSQIYPYPDTNVKNANTYSFVMQNTNISGNDIPGAASSNVSNIDSCMNACNNNNNCDAFVYDTSGPSAICLPKNISQSNVYSLNNFSVNNNMTTYIRDKTFITPITGASNTINNIDSLRYQNYGTPTSTTNTSSNGISSAISVYRQQLSQLQDKLNLLASQINNVKNKFTNDNNLVNIQTQKDIVGFDKYLLQNKLANAQIDSFNKNNIDNMLNDTNIKTLQQNYSYLAWSILAVGIVIVAIKVKNNQ